MMKTKKSILSALKIVVALSVVFSFAACDTGNNDKPDEAAKFAGTPVFEVCWTGAFSPDYVSDSVKVKNADGDVIATSTGAMSLLGGPPTDTFSQVQEGGFFNSKTAINFTTVGQNWSGCFFKIEGSFLDLSSVTKAFVAIKGDLGEAKHFGLKMMWDATGENELNFLNYPASDGENGWTVYTVDLKDFTGLDQAKCIGAGVWSPNVIDGPVSEREFPLTNYLAVTDVLVSVAFGN